MAVYLVCDHLLAYTGLAGNKHGGIGSRYMPDFLPDTIQRLGVPNHGAGLQGAAVFIDGGHRLPLPDFLKIVEELLKIAL